MARLAGTLVATATLMLGIAPAARGAETLYILSGTALAVAPADAVNTPFSTTAITGLAGGENPIALEFDPNDGKLYLLALITPPSPDQVRLYVVNPTTAAATAVGAAVSTPAGVEATSVYTMDMNPAVDRLRVIRGPDGRHFRLIPATGAFL